MVISTTQTLPLTKTIFLQQMYYKIQKMKIVLSLYLRFRYIDLIFEYLLILLNLILEVSEHE